MRIVATGASGDFGSNIIPELLRRGHDVVGLSRRPHSLAYAGYRHVAADVRDVDAVAAAMQGADAVVHMAWTTHPMHDAAATRAIDIGGTVAVLEAMKRTGVGRLVATSSVMAFGANADNPALLTERDRLRPSVKHLYSVHKAEAETLVADSGISALMVRASNIMGRHATGVTREGFAMPRVIGLKGALNTMQFIHPDDLARFYADAVEHPDWTGPVNLAAADTIHVEEIARILGKKVLTLSPGLVEAALGFLWDRKLYTLDPGAIEALQYFPLVDTTRLTDELGFRPVWSSRECVEDFGRANREHVYLGSRRVEVPWRWPFGHVPEPAPHTPERVEANAQGKGGEFDTTIDPEWSIFTAANTSEAFPGPMTPLAIELGWECLRAGGAQAAHILRFDGDVARVLREEPVGIFGHGIYANMSVVIAMSAAMPGGDNEAWEDMLFGASDALDLPQVEPLSRWALAKVLPSFLAKVATMKAESLRVDADARALQRDAAHFAKLTDAALASRLLRARDEVANAWALASQGSAFIAPVMGLIEKQAGKTFARQVTSGTENLASAGMALGTHRLADYVRREAAIGAVLAEHEGDAALAVLRHEHPAFVRRVEHLLAEYGHRGPRETELISQVFADLPGRLVDVVAKLARGPERPTLEAMPMNRRVRALAAIGARFQTSRERIRDAAIRHTHQYRLIAREIGTRLVAQGVIDERDDVFFLVRDEVLHPPRDARDVVARRRDERARLEKDRPPLNFAGSWELAEDNAGELAVGQSVQGVPVSPGTVRGPVRVLTVDTMDDLEPGEVLVAAFTDTGWTPFFSFAAAVLVDTGGEMSHAAVVAREFGVPCVVGTSNGSLVLRTGHVVEVDGVTGTVTRVG